MNMVALTVSQAAENITRLARQRLGNLPDDATMQVTDTSGAGLVSVAWYDRSGYPLFAVNVDLQGTPASRQQLQQVLGTAPPRLTWL
jgi:hypothetical protein